MITAATLQAFAQTAQQAPRTTALFQNVSVFEGEVMVIANSAGCRCQWTDMVCYLERPFRLNSQYRVSLETVVI
jgi:hypothetical protein